ncbi:hypothetical protein A6A03_06925 [Chloroflexus islandicus]|uniref:Uncharacterized protein n=1 Tax=Chloroflexus islandicus TaxID=1707952 RepID=A0A178MM70_9CHLR|nr:hypothetical protein [Chloroflexus islandicus]OAN49034.1 hypothetical protein A6A03_06925 [Chloroflexus islandicus]
MSDQNTSSSSASTVTLDTTERKHLSHIAHLAAYRALQRCAATAVEQIANTVPVQRPVVFVDRLIDERDALLVEYARARLMAWQRKSVSDQRGMERSQDGLPMKVDATKQTLELAPIKTTLDSVEEIINALANVTNSLAKLTALFRSEFTLFPVTTAIDSNTLRAALAFAFVQRKWQTSSFPLPDPKAEDGHHPTLFHLIKTIAGNLADTPPASSQQFLEMLKACDSELQQIFTPPPIVTTTSDGATPAQTNTTSESLLARALLVERLRRADQHYQLAARITQVGSDMMIRKHLFSADRLTFIGGCTIEYVLAKPNGEIVAANLVQSSEQITLKLGMSKSKINCETLS